jgi:DNA/RNA endonuclease YhcR with UshA esterase domain
MSRAVLTLAGWAVFACLSNLEIRAADPPVIKVAEVAQHVDKEATVELVVQSSRLLDTRAFCFLNSEKEFDDKDNFTVAIRGAALDEFAAKEIKDPAEYYRGKTIRVTGKITLYKERPQIVVEGPKQIVVIGKLELKR